MMDIKKTLMGLATVALAGMFFASSAVASSEMPQRDHSRTPAMSQQDQTMGQKEAKSLTMPKAQDLIGKDIVGANNETLGTLDEIVVHRDNGRIAYGVLAYGGFLGIGEKYHAVPWNALSLQEKDGDHVLALNIAQDKLEATEGFDKSNWPMKPTLQVSGATTAMSSESGISSSDSVALERDPSAASPDEGRLEEPIFEEDREGYGYMGEEALDEEAREEISRDPVTSEDVDAPEEPYGYMGDQPATTDRSATREKSAPSTQAQESDALVANGQLLKVSELSDWNIRHMEQNIGSVKDLVIDMKNAHLPYAIVSFNDTHDQLNNRVAVVPWSALSLDTQNNALSFRTDVDTDRLLAVSYPEDQIPDLSDRSFAQRLHTQFNVEPYWQTFGYVGEETGDATREMKSDVQKGAQEMKQESKEGYREMKQGVEEGAQETREGARELERDIDRQY